MPDYVDKSGKISPFAPGEVVSKEPQVIIINQETGQIKEVGLQAWDEDSGEELAIGVVVPGRTKTSIKYLENARDYNVKPESVQRQIELSNMIYYWEGVVGTTIDLFIDFAVTDLILQGLPENSREYAICKHWLDEVNSGSNNMVSGARALAKELLLDYFIAGNVFPFRVYSRVPGANIRSIKVRGGNYSLPMSIYPINPMNIHIPDHSILIGNKEIWLKFEDDVIEMLTGDLDGDITRAILSGLPSAMQAQLKKEGRVKLPDDQVTHIKRRSRGYEAWGRPFLARAFQAIAMKKKIQALDETTIDGLINNIVIFKVGDPDEFKQTQTRKTWSRNRLAHFAALISNPNPSNYLVWTPDVDVIQVGPGESVVQFDRKYEQADRDILKALGIPTVLISGEGASADRSENVWVSVSGLMERLDNARNQIKIYLEEILFEILKRNKLPINRKPKLKWRKMNLRNEKEVREFVTNWWDRGVLGTRTSLEELGYTDYDEIRRVRKDESSSGDDKVFKPRELPFSGSGQKSAQPKLGRPPGSNKPKTGVTNTLKNKKPVTRPGVRSKADIYGDMVTTMIESSMDNIAENFVGFSSFDTLGTIVGEFKQICRVFEDVCAMESASVEEIREKIDDIENDLTTGIMEAEGAEDLDRIKETLEQSKEKLIQLAVSVIQDSDS